nr:MAG TPA: hypothetical protein [Caudoviricetes sp.]
MENRQEQNQQVQKKVIIMSEKQKEFLVSIGIDPNDELDVIEDKVGDYLTLNCLDENYNPNEEGLMCESILDYIGQL